MADFNDEYANLSVKMGLSTKSEICSQQEEFVHKKWNLSTKSGICPLKVEFIHRRGIDPLKVEYVHKKWNFLTKSGICSQKGDKFVESLQVGNLIALLIHGVDEILFAFTGGELIITPANRPH